MKKKMRFFPSPRLLLAILHIASAFFSIVASQLADDEVKALREIKQSLGKTNGWDFNVDPCSGQGGWYESKDNNINCTCPTLTNGTCHVQHILLKEQNLSGVLPPQLFKLPYLVEFDVTRNYLNGTIPSEWGSTRLLNISLLGNRLTGSIPREIGNITSLESLVVECNQLSGSLPPELGNLTRIERLLLSSNNFTGELPSTLAKLTALKQFRIPDNNFTGKIPNFIEKWTNLTELFIQSSGLQGPIPDGIALLQKVTNLRITDLNGPEARFPPLDNMTSLERLILRSCNLSGPLPGYFRGMTNLETLDLSFNKLNGTIPKPFTAPSIRYMYLTGNLFTGPVPDLLETEQAKAIDFSYNNFTSGYSECKPKMNLFGSSLESNKPGNPSCLGSQMKCSQKRYGFSINCGGEETTIGKITYDADITDIGGAETSLSNVNSWGLSNTGDFMDNGNDADKYTTKNKSILVMNNSKLYMSARLSPLSLTYFGFCLVNGNYTVILHFAEIIFTDDKTYASLGRRIFDVYVQGELVLSDFNIEAEAGGIGKEVNRTFHTNVSSETLEIRFYWKGRGTTPLPDRGVYGPLISAINVKSDFNPPTNISTGAVIGIVAAVAFVIILILGIVLWWKSCLWFQDRMEHDLKNLDLHTGSFTLRQIKAATNNFDAANKIGEGGFGSVYKGLLLDGTIIAVKQLSSKSKQGNREFVNEIGMISALQHPHLVKLYGCCIEGNQLLLVYEYMENNCLARALFGPEECLLELNWATRHKICVGIARGLAYLHEESRLKIVHRDIKATNVLLDKNFNPKISDFGLAKLDEEDSTHISTRIAGTYGYMAPEYAMRGYLTDKADVYSFGIVALEIVSGRSNVISKTKEKSFYLLDWVLVLKEEGNLMELVDPRLGSDFNKEEVMAMINVAIRCTNVSPGVRPSMSSVVSMLEGRSIVGELISDPSDDMETNNHLQDIQEHNMSETQGLIKGMSIDGRWTTSTSASDLYPINLDSDYLEKRE